jgi:hypothetical protein
MEDFSMYNDKIILDQLSEIRMYYFEAYLNLKQNINAIYQKLAMAEADKAFRDISNSPHAVYELDKIAHGLMATYLNISNLNADECYIVVIHGYYACLFMLNSHGYIKEKKHILGNEQVEDLCETFRPYLIMSTDYEYLQEDVI